MIRRSFAWMPLAVLASFLAECLLVGAFSGRYRLTSFTRQSARPLRLGLMQSPGEDKWLTTGMLVSSFSDGIKPSEQAQDFLMHGLVKALWMERQKKAEKDVEESVIQSPCCGPDVSALDTMEDVDVGLSNLEEQSGSWEALMESLGDEERLELRFLYIPTAMYALRKGSNNTPGKQRQKARADGKSRRNEIVKVIEDKLGEKASVLAATLDLDDGSIKHPEGVDDLSRFPENGKDALRDWNPHLIYVQGGNTFWLYHCIEKGDWAMDLCNACTGPNAAVYCGTSAGAIIMGDSMETACWKGWDDPSVVPGKETYEDWESVKGFGLVGNSSFFPHMDDQWKELVAEKQNGMPATSKVYCLRDEEVCCVDGRKKSIEFVSSSSTLAAQPTSIK